MTKEYQSFTEVMFLSKGYTQFKAVAGHCLPADQVTGISQVQVDLASLGIYTFITKIIYI